MVTTNLSYAQPERLPFREGTYFFDPSEMLERFPRDIVARMIAPDGAPIPDDEWDSALQAMPGLDLPIVVATRLQPQLSAALLGDPASLESPVHGGVGR